MNKTRVSPTSQEPHQPGLLDDIDFTDLSDNDATSQTSERYLRSEVMEKMDNKGFVILPTENIAGLHDETESTPAIEEFVKLLNTRTTDQKSISSEIRKDIDENTTQLKSIENELKDVNSIRKDVTQIENQLDDFVTQEDLEQNVNESTSQQINERVVAPLLFGTGFLLSLAAVGALAIGSLLIALVTAPLPIMIGYYLFKHRNI